MAEVPSAPGQHEPCPAPCISGPQSLRGACCGPTPALAHLRCPPWEALAEVGWARVASCPGTRTGSPPQTREATPTPDLQFGVGKADPQAQCSGTLFPPPTAAAASCSGIRGGDEEAVSPHLPLPQGPTLPSGAPDPGVPPAGFLLRVLAFSGSEG